jgi:hypothetical protein
VTAPRRQRQEKRSPEEIRALLIEAGTDLLLQPGARGVMTPLTLTAVFQKIKDERGIRLTNASVIGRVFDSVADFRRSVFLSVAGGGSEDFAAASDHVFKTVISKADLSSPDLRWQALQETCRVSSNFMLKTMDESPTWRLWLNIMAFAITDPEANADLISALKLSYQRLDQQSLETYSAALSILGFRPVDAQALMIFSFWADSMAEGVGIRMLVDSGARKTLALPTGPGGERQSWTKFALAFWSLVKVAVELDPNWVAL